MSDKKNVAILLSGGVGSRISSDVPKQYMRKNGEMMITYVLRTLFESKRIDGVSVVAGEAWRDEIRGDIEALCGSDRCAHDQSVKLIGFADPGENRQRSIINALEMLETERPETVFIHDAARPYITQEMINVCFDALGGHDGVLPVLPMKDTVYLSRDGISVSELLDRSEVFAGQAPELFLYEVYLEANRRLSAEELLKINGSTEPAIMAGMDIVMIPGDERNCKVTTSVDMEKWLES